MYDSIAAHSRLGLNAIVDVAHHDAYAVPRGILPDCARRLVGLPVLFVGVRCPIEIIVQRRRSTGWDTGGPADTELLSRLQLWQQEVHTPGIYDLEMDTSVLRPEVCAALIRQHLDQGPPSKASNQLAAMATPTTK
jgi:chloramphenicol 3-O phosphotransferase